jgi:hypothetical protein
MTQSAGSRERRNRPGQNARTANPATTSFDPTASGTVNDLVEQHVTWGLVESYAVDAERLRIKLNVSAIGRQVLWVGVDDPHYRAAVSMAMMAFHTPGTRLTARYTTLRGAQPIESNVFHALEVGLGNDPSEALAFDEWQPLI